MKLKEKTAAGKFHIVYGKYGEYRAVIYAVSYFNPLEDISLIAEELGGRLKDADVLFDLLLCNGENFNRFACAHFDGNSINPAEICLAEKIGWETLREINRWYRGRRNELENSVLTKSQINKYL